MLVSLASRNRIDSGLKNNFHPPSVEEDEIKHEEEKLDDEAEHEDKGEERGDGEEGGAS